MSIVYIKTIGDFPLQSSKVYFLNLKNKLSDIRKELRKYKIINDTLSFSKKNNNDAEFYEIVRESEENFLLEQIIDEVNDDNSKSFFLYLKSYSNPTWDVLNDNCKLDYGCTMSFDGIKKANKRAFIMKGCGLTYIDSKGYKKDQLEFESKEDWIKKTNLFVNVDDYDDIKNFIKFGFSVSFNDLQKENLFEEIKSTYQYIEIGKVILKLSKGNLEPTPEFINAVKDAIKSKNPKEVFKEITEEYGQFIPTEVILGGRVYFKDVEMKSDNFIKKSEKECFNIGSSTIEIENKSRDSKKKSKFYSFNYMKLLGGKHPSDKDFDEDAEKNWIESLKDYQNWDCIEFKDPISIFQLLPDDLRKESIKSIGKRILHASADEYCDYYLYEPGAYRNFVLNNMPYISRIIQNKDAECDVFATVVDTEDSKNIFFNCQVFSDSESKPSIIIHGIQKEFRPRKYKLKVGWMVIGYDIDFDFILSDISVELIKKKYNLQDQQFFNGIELQLEHDLMTKNIPFFGIPILSNLNSSNNSITIGHNFYNKESKYKIDAFSYCSKENRYVELPNFTFCTLIILNNPTSSTYKLFPFEFNKFSIFENKPFIDLKESFTSQSNSLNPKCISLYLSKENNYNPIFLNQNSKQINAEYVDCKCNKTCPICKDKTLRISDEDNALCIVYSLR
ncbi:hypothetical protein C1645_816731 [Glomus cerebriforme]|uniref:DUF7431 domain-containing protein n=1 Tax=Glomus cerebriforme TaxID=658196 RepID=A0A397TAR5_9GLOM|nr:hypothetical protein C1645_816731 [Glomus cerebriforme]